MYGFVKNSPVITFKGEKNIDQLCFNEKIISFQKNKMVCVKINKINIDIIENYNILIIFLEKKNIFKTLICSYNQPIYCEYKWVDAIKLEKHKYLYSLDYNSNSLKEEYKIFDIQNLNTNIVKSHIKIYNLELDTNSYFVNDILVRSISNKLNYNDLKKDINETI